MTDQVRISDSIPVHSVHDVEQGICEYLEEQHEPHSSMEQQIALPVRLKGWLWRREGLGIFYYYRRRFCVFNAKQAQFDVYATEEEKRKPLRHMILTRVTLLSRTDRSFIVHGYFEDQVETVDTIRRRPSELRRGSIPTEMQSVYKWKEEKFKAVSAKACSVWTHCFQHYMTSYALRKQKMAQEEIGDETARLASVMRDEETQAMMTMMMDPDFVFEDATKVKRRATLFVSSFRSSLENGLLWTTGSGIRRKLSVRKRGSLEHRVCIPPKSASHQAKSDQIIVASTSTMDDGLAMRNADKVLQRREELVEKQSSVSIADLPCVSGIWKDKELLSHRVIFDEIVKKEKLATGACGEVWRAVYRSQEVVIKTLLEKVMVNVNSPTSIAGSDVHAVYRRRRAILKFIEEIRIMSRLEHSRIVEFRGVAMTFKRDIYLVMEYLPRGDLQMYLSAIRRKGLNNGFQSIWTWTKHQWRLAIDIIEGLVYLHSLNPSLVHGDIKSANILLRDNLRAKLTDFGLSRYLSSDEDKDAELADDGRSGGRMSRHGTRAYGTGRWMAPELIKCETQSSIASDVYAFGIVLSEIDTCELPFHEREKPVACSSATSVNDRMSDDSNLCLMNESEFARKIVTNSWKPSFRVTCPEVIKKLAHECLVSDPKKRPTSLAVAHRLRQAASTRERPETVAAQVKAITSLHIR